MTLEFERRTLLQMLGLGVVGGTALGESWPAFAQGKDTVTIGWPSDVPSWDPNQRFAPDAQSIFKLVFDTAIDQGPDLKYIPRLVSKWELAADGLSLALEIARAHHGELTLEPSPDTEIRLRLALPFE